MTDSKFANYLNRRNLDVFGERMTSEFLKTYFYPLLGEDVIIDYNTDAQKQFKGLDVTIDADGKVYKIDEKGSFHYYGKPWLKTFSHEINAINLRNEVYRGWLLQGDSLSDYWLYVWVEESDVPDYKEMKSIANIKHATVALVSKKAIYELMHKNNITGAKLFETANYVRDQGWKEFMYHGFKLTVLGEAFRERTANILIPKEILKNIAACSMVYDNGEIEFKDNRGE